MDSTKGSFYVLQVISSKPYHYGAEYWFRSTAVEIVDCLEPWMFENESFAIALVQLDNPEFIAVDDEMDLNPEDIETLEFAKEKAPLIDQKYKDKYPAAKLEDIELRVCNACFIFTEKDICCECHYETKNPDY